MEEEEAERMSKRERERERMCKGVRKAWYSHRPDTGEVNLDFNG